MVSARYSCVFNEAGARVIFNGDAEKIVAVYDLERIERDKRKDALATALDKAKEHISTKRSEQDEETETEI